MADLRHLASSLSPQSSDVERWKPITVRSVGRSWTSIFLNSAIDAENISVSISPGKKRPVQNPIPIILGIIIVQLAWMLSFFVKVVANIGQEEAVSRLKIISAKNARTTCDSLEQLVRLPALPTAGRRRQGVRRRGE